MEFTLKEEIIDKLNQILESIDIIQVRCEEYHSVKYLPLLAETVQLIKQELS